jgi:hypothetical protein
MRTIALKICATLAKRADLTGTERRNRYFEGGSDPAHQPEDQHDQKDQAQATAWVIAPAGAIWPAWQGAN